MQNPLCNIDLSVIEQNILYLRSIAKNQKFMMLVKSNAYGFGIIPITKFVFDNNLAEFVGVIRSIEALEICREYSRKNNQEIMILTEPNLDELEELIDNNIILTVYKFETVDEIEKISKRINKKARIHIKVNTGMNRIGVSIDKFDNLLEKILESENIALEGIFTHFIDSYDLDTPTYDEQLVLFDKSINIAKSYIDTGSILIHAANSSAILRSAIKGESSSLFDMVRAGISAYGYFASDSLEKLFNTHIKPSVEIKANIININNLNVNDSVGYSKRHICDKPTQVAVVPIGYGDGVSRLLGLSDYKVLVNGVFCDILGTLQMDTMFVDITDANAKLGDEIVLVGKSQDAYLSAEELGDALGIEHYEVFVRMTPRLNKNYIH